VLGELGRLLALVPAVGDGAPRDPATAHARGVALVAAVDTARAGSPPRAGDDLDDPYGLSAREFARVADEIEATVVPLAARLAG
jgi:protein-tyrosine phosphatase